MATNNQKVDFDAALTHLMEELERIDGGELSQSQRTAQYKRLAAKIINTYLHDGDNYKAKSKLSISTLNKYLTKLRTAVRAAGYRHHSLTTGATRSWNTVDKDTGKSATYMTLAKLMSDYPEHATMLECLRHEPAVTLRKRAKEIAEGVIQSAHPTKRDRDLFRLINSGLKLEHEILFHLSLDSAQKSKVKQLQRASLTAKQHDSIAITRGDVAWLINTALASDSMYKQMYGLALASGRRFIEIAKQGDFTASGANTVIFSGQAKKRAGHDEKPYEIHTLIPASEFLVAFSKLRGSPKLAALHARVTLKRAERGIVSPDFDNAMLNAIAANSAADAARWMMMRVGLARGEQERCLYIGSDTDVQFKDTRAIYAATCLRDLRDVVAPNMDDNAFVGSIMGHEGGTAHLNYRQFRLVERRESATDAPTTVAQVPAADEAEVDDRALAALNRAFLRVEPSRKALTRCHETLMAWLRANPHRTITQSSMEKAAKAGNRVVIRDYINALADVIEAYNKSR